MTTFHDAKTNKFLIVDAVTGALVETFPPFDTFQQARDAIGDAWDNGDALYPDLDL